MLNKDIVSLTACEVLWRAASSFLHSFGILKNTHPMNIYALLYFKHKNDATIIIKLLYKATSRSKFW